MKIAANTAVSLDYSLHLGDGVIIDRSDEGEPLTYLHGQGQIVPGLERELDGLEVGAQKRVVVAPKDGYGERQEGRQQKVPLDAFGGETPTVGDEFYAAGPDGMPIPVQVIAVQGKEVTIDLNHPLAGKTLHFSIEVKEVREATAEELEHGHVHGPDGHDHDEDDGHDH